MDVVVVDEDLRKRHHQSYSDHHTATKRQKTPDSDEEGVEEERAVMAAWLSSMDDDDDESAYDLSTLLENEITYPVKVKIIDNPANSSSPPLIFQSSTSYVTINGNEESCGSSFSESECSVMVGINSGFRNLGGGAWDVEVARGDDLDDDMLEKFLGEGFAV